jgi:hypothetical protein
VVQWSEFLATDPEVRVRFPELPDFLRSTEPERRSLGRHSSLADLGHGVFVVCLRKDCTYITWRLTSVQEQASLGPTRKKKLIAEPAHLFGRRAIVT